MCNRFAIIFLTPSKTSRDLKLRRGEEITLIRQVDENWYEGEVDGTQGYLPANYVEVSLTICKQCTVQYCSWSGETFHHRRLQCNVKGLELHCMTQYLSRNRVRNPLKNNPKIPTCAAQLLDHSMCHHCRDPGLTMCSQCSPPLVLHQQVGNNIEGMTHLDNLYKIPIPSSPSLLPPTPSPPPSPSPGLPFSYPLSLHLSLFTLHP